MLPNRIPELETVINESAVPIVVLVISGECEPHYSKLQIEFEETIKQRPEPLVLYNVCVDEVFQPFP